MSRLPAVLAAMEREEIDVMIVGREANARVVAGTARLWLAGTRAFAPGCVVVRSTRAVHVLSNSDDAVPPGYDVSRLYGITWNPERLFGAIGAMPGVAGARRVAVDGMTPLMHTMLGMTIPEAEFVDASPVLSELWGIPDVDAAAGVEAAAQVACAGMSAMAAALAPGARARTLRGVCANTFASFGVTTPAFEAVACPLDGSSSTWLAPERLLDDGEIVAMRAGVLRDGWEASVARTFRVAVPAEDRPPPAGWDALVAACRPAVLLGSLRTRDAVIYGVGRGVEPWDDELVLEQGMLCAIELATDQALRQDIVRITDDEPELVTRFV